MAIWPFWRSSSSKNISQDEGDLENALQNWNPPRVPTSKIYKRRGIFESTRYCKIETTEKTVIIQSEYLDLQLHDKNSIARHKREYQTLHMGLVQVAIKPLTRNGMNKSVLVCLRDCRHLKFNNSRLAVAEFSLKNGPVYFNCYPSYRVSLQDPRILDTLTLNLKIHGFNSENQIDSRDIVVVYKVHYKVMISPLSRPNHCKIYRPSMIRRMVLPNDSPKAKNDLSVGSTTFVETNLADNNISVQQITNWDSVEIPDRWSVKC